MEMRIIAPGYGDKRVHIDKENKKDVKKAEALFNKLMGDKFKQYKAYGYKLGEKIGVPIKKFSTEFSRIILTPPMAGG
jgi:hypothetical protein